MYLIHGFLPENIQQTEQVLLNLDDSGGWEMGTWEISPYLGFLRQVTKKPYRFYGEDQLRVISEKDKRKVLASIIKSEKDVSKKVTVQSKGEERVGIRLWKKDGEALIVDMNYFQQFKKLFEGKGNLLLVAS